MQYVVEFMRGEGVASSMTLEASTPFVAASKAARGTMVHFSVDRKDWIRVTPSGSSAVEYGYTRTTDDAAARKPVRKLGTRKV